MILIVILLIVAVEMEKQQLLVLPREKNVYKENIVTVFYQGNHASRHQAAIYAGKEGLDIQVSDAVTDHISIPSAPLILYNLFTYKELDSISYDYYSLNPVHWAIKGVHGLKHLYYGIEGVTHLPHTYITVNDVGGAEDVRQCVAAIRACIKENPEKQLVLFGCSRGAATVVTSLIFLEPFEQKQIKLVIAEAPFDTVESVVHATYYNRVFSSAIVAFGKNVALYKSDQVSPLDAVLNERFPLDVPIAFITSDIDNTVPKQNTMRLIDVLKKRNHLKMHHLELKRSPHSSMPISDPEDKESYNLFVHKLYDMYCVDAKK